MTAEQLEKLPVKPVDTEKLRVKAEHLKDLKPATHNRNRAAKAMIAAAIEIEHLSSRNASLARRVLAAEKLVEALEENAEHILLHKDISKALNAYREASK